MLWAKVVGWKVPAMHAQMAKFLDLADRVKVMLVFRGGAKSSICAVKNAHSFYKDPTWRMIVQSADNSTAFKTSRETKSLLRRHPLTKGMMPPTATAIDRWSVLGNPDERNHSLTASGVLSNITSSRANEFQFDDVEVPKNIRTASLRESLRARLDEPTHILLPGGKKTWVGTPHTFDSIYEEQIAAGAKVLKIPLFAKQTRYRNTLSETRYNCDHIPKDRADLFVFVGIHRFARLLELGRDFTIKGNTLVMAKPPMDVLDIYSGNAWPSRFTRAEVLFRRRETRSLNSWDSQYQLEAKPVEERRLDPTRIWEYDIEPHLTFANGRATMMLGRARIVSMRTWWDCALGKPDKDASVLTMCLQDDGGRLYLHRMVGLTGDLEREQCKDIRDLVIKFHIPQITVETNGPGGFVPPILRRKLNGTACGVLDHWESVNKNERILDAWEAPLSARFLYAHSSVLDGPLWDQMRDFNPKETAQPDDYLDSGAGAITAQPVRLDRIPASAMTGAGVIPWRPDSGVADATLEY